LQKPFKRIQDKEITLGLRPGRARSQDSRV